MRSARKFKSTIKKGVRRRSKNTLTWVYISGMVSQSDTNISPTPERNLSSCQIIVFMDISSGQRPSRRARAKIPPEARL